MDWSSTTAYSLCLIRDYCVCSLSVTDTCHIVIVQCKEKCVAISNCHCLEYTYLLGDHNLF